MNENIKFHKIANLWPMMSDQEIKSLAQDIKENGLIQPIYLYEGKIIDGRNRWKACQLSNVKAKTLNYTGDNPVAFAWSLNEKRRHMSTAQRSALAAQAKPLYESEAKKRQEAGNNQHSLKEIIPEPSKGQARDKVAEIFGTNGSYVSKAEKIKNQSPDTFKKMLDGKISMQDAIKEVKKIPLDPWTKDERIRQSKVKKGQSVLANLSKDLNLIQWAESQGLAVWIDRTSIYGNPFLLDKDGTRSEVCRKYEKYYLPHKKSIKIETLKGKVLVCHCYPEECHGNALLKQTTKQKKQND